MIDRYGKKLYVGWAAHEILWLEAAISLPRHEHTRAFRDIADMSGRSLAAVQFKAYRILQEQLDVKVAGQCARQKAEHEAMLARRSAADAMEPSRITPVSNARLMGARA